MYLHVHMQVYMYAWNQEEKRELGLYCMIMPEMQPSDGYTMVHHVQPMLAKQGDESRVNIRTPGDAFCPKLLTMYMYIQYVYTKLNVTVANGRMCVCVCVCVCVYA